MASITNGHESSPRRLSVEQENAIDLLVMGVTDREAAQKAGIARETISRWRNDNPYFLAELNRRR
jgi:transposase